MPWPDQRAIWVFERKRYCNARRAAQSPSAGFVTPMICNALRRNGRLGKSDWFCVTDFRIPTNGYWPVKRRGVSEGFFKPYSTVTDFARLRGWSTSVPFTQAV